MATIGKLAKPAWIPMSAKEWDMLNEAHQRKLISEVAHRHLFPNLPQNL